MAWILYKRGVPIKGMSHELYEINLGINIGSRGMDILQKGCPNEGHVMRRRVQREHIP